MTLFPLDKKLLWITFWGIIMVECVSLLGHLWNPINTLAFFIVSAAVLVLALWRLEIAWWVVVSELVISSFGYLFSYEVGGFKLSIRLALFIIVFLVWVYRALRKRSREFRHSWLYTPSLILATMVVIGVVNGLHNGHSLTDVFLDMNGYLYFAFLPVAFTVINSWRRIKQLASVVIAGVLAVVCKTLVLLFYFAHATDEYFIRLIYTWVRDTRVGEISPIVDHYYRIFFQGHSWVLFVFVGSVVILLLVKRTAFRTRELVWWWSIFIATSTTLIISFSRSIWLGLLITVAGLAYYTLRTRQIHWRRLAIVLATAVGIIAIELLLITAIVNVPLPGSSGGSISAGSLVTERITRTDEPAVGSRFQLLGPLTSTAFAHPIIGSGFGTTVTYQSLDPRTSAVNGGQYTTYSFEWGYLDTITEMGVLGLFAYLYFIWVIARAGMALLKKTHQHATYVFIVSLLFMIVALVSIHATTPYLNHPLGIGLLIMVAAVLHAIQRELPHAGKAIEKIG